MPSSFSLLAGTFQLRAPDGLAPPTHEEVEQG